jgi:outer membrane protein
MPNKLCHNNCNKKSGTEMDTLVSGVKKFIKAYGKRKGYISMELEMLLFCMLKKNMISQRYCKALNDKYKLLKQKIKLKKQETKTEKK